MADKPVDYAALAQQARTGNPNPATPDYSALADQVRSGSATPAATGPNVSPGASDEDIIRSFGYDPAVIQKSPLYQKAKQQNGSGVSFMLTDPNRKDLIAKLADSKLGDLGQGAFDLVEGASQFGRHLFSKLGLMDSADTPYMDLLTRVQHQDYQQNIRHGNANPLVRFTGNLVAGGALPGIGTAEEAGLGAKVLAGGANGAISGATQPVEVPGSGDYWKDKAVQTGTGAAVGAAVPAVVGGASRAVAKVAAKIKGSPAVQLPEQVTAAAENANRAAEATDAASKMAADRQGSALVSMTETNAAKARTAAQGGAQQTVENLRGGMAETPRNTAELEQAAAGGDRHAAMVLDQVGNAGEDPARIYQSGISLQNWKAGQAASQNYDRVGELVDQHALGTIPLTGTAKALGRIEVDARLGLKDRGLDRTLADIRDALTPEAPAAPPPSGVVTPSGAPVVAPKPAAPGMQADYSTTRKVVSQLDQIIRTGRTGDNALVSDRGIAQVQQIKNALEGDASQFVKKSGVPELSAAQESADQFYKNAVVPFKDVTVAKSGTTDEPDTIFKKFVMAGRGDRAQKFYNALDSKGQAAVQYEIVSDAFNKATDQATGEFSPKAFFNAMDKVKDAHGVFFQGRDRMVIDGLKNLMTTAIDRDASVGAAKSVAETGAETAAQVGKFNVAATKEAGAQKVADIEARVRGLDKYPLGRTAAVAGAMTEGFAHLGMPVPAMISGSIAGITGSLKAAMMTDAGRRFLLASSLLKPGTQGLINRLDQLASGRILSRAATDTPAR